MSWLPMMHYVLARPLPQQLAYCHRHKGSDIIYRQMLTADNEVKYGLVWNNHWPDRVEGVTGMSHGAQDEVDGHQVDQGGTVEALQSLTGDMGTHLIKFLYKTRPGGRPGQAPIFDRWNAKYVGSFILFHRTLNMNINEYWPYQFSVVHSLNSHIPGALYL